VTEPARVVYQQFVRDSTRWDGFRFRPGDIVISTPTKCGTTWMQMICALLVLQTPEFDRPLDRISPWLDMVTRPRADVIDDLEAQQHRRFIKTHTPLDGLPLDDQVTYICVGRDPRDVALSWDNHRQNMDRDALAVARAVALGSVDVGGVDPGRAGALATPRERFWAWVDDPTPPTAAASSLWITLHHIDTFWPARDDPNVILVHYADLRSDLAAQMRRLADRLSISVPEAGWPALVDAATLSSMRSRADDLAPNTTEGLWHDNRKFFNRGTSGQWREFLDDADQQRYRRRVAELVGPDLAAWVHHEPASVG
jgi:aryl sulfotransferase